MGFKTMRPWALTWCTQVSPTPITEQIAKHQSTLQVILTEICRFSL